ncbi:MAG: nucleotidyltransferase family protein [Thermodesulfovibrionales bacterium]
MGRKKAVATLEEVKEILIEHKSELIEKYKIKELGIFGSFVRGEQKKRSDVDILVEYYEVPDLFELIALERHLSRLIRKKVDLVRKGGIRKELKEKILKEVVPL